MTLVLTLRLAGVTDSRIFISQRATEPCQNDTWSIPLQAGD